MRTLAEIRTRLAALVRAGHMTAREAAGWIRFARLQGAVCTPRPAVEAIPLLSPACTFAVPLALVFSVDGE